jgi:LacI family transcriptional regulator, repressor for deo operon, udp, cdd, tsx, nupC, and nupG
LSKNLTKILKPCNLIIRITRQDILFSFETKVLNKTGYFNMAAKKRPTQADVAKLAGVTQATVSFVLNDSDTISVPPETRQRILDAVEQLGYRPNSLARGLVSGNSSLIAVTVPAISDFFSDIVHGIEDVARQSGYSVILSTTNDDPKQELANLEIFSSRQVDGTIICGSRLEADDLSRIAHEHRLALLTSKAPVSAGIVKIPGEDGLYTVTSHLIRLGHTKIGHIGWQPAGENEREPGYHRALHEHNIIPDSKWVAVAAEATIEEGARCLNEILQRAPEVTAITCYSDTFAMGAMLAARRLNRRLPEDLAIVGFDDIPAASLVSPALTTVHVPRYRTGQLLMEVLLRVMNAKSDYEEEHEVDLHLVVRESCGSKHPHSAAEEQVEDLLAEGKE